MPAGGRRLGRGRPNRPIVRHGATATSGGSLTLRGENSSSSNSVALTVSTPAGTQAGDLLVLTQADDFYSLAGLQTPSGAGTWSEEVSARYDGGTNSNHCKVWTATATSSGAVSISVPFATTDQERYAQVFAFGGGQFDVATSNTQISGTTWSAGSVTASSSGDYLIVCAGTDGSATVTNFTFPASMTACTEQDVGGFATYRSAYELLGVSGATGSRSVTLAAARVGFTVTLAVKPSGAGGAVSLDGSFPAASSAAGTSADVARALDATASGTNGATGSPSVDRLIAATASAAADAVGGVSASRPVAGQGEAADSASGTSIIRAAGLAASSPSASGMSGVFVADRPLTAVGAAASGASGALSVDRPVSATGSAASGATGNLTKAGQVSLDGTFPAASQASATVGANRPLTSIAPAAAEFSGTAAVSRPVSATCSAAAGLTGDLGVFSDVLLDGKLVGAAHLTGVATVTRALDGAVGGAAHLTGTPALARSLTGATAASASADGVFLAARPLGGLSSTAGSATADLSVAPAVSRGSMSPVDRDAPSMSPADRTAPGMSPVERRAAAMTGV